MAEFRQLLSSFFMGGVRFVKPWLGNGLVFYDDPAYGWVCTPIASFGRTITADGDPLVRQGGTYDGLPWYKGSSYILFHRAGRWLLYPLFVTSAPAYVADFTYDSAGAATDTEYYVAPLAFYPWAAEGTYAFSGGRMFGTKAVVVSAPAISKQTTSEIGPGIDAFGAYEDGHWLGTPHWQYGSTHIRQYPGAYSGIAEVSAGVWEIAGLVSDGGGVYRGTAPLVGSDATFEEHVVDEATGTYVPTGETIAFEWRGYGVSSVRDDVAGRRVAIAEAAVWR